MCVYVYVCVIYLLIYTCVIYLPIYTHKCICGYLLSLTTTWDFKIDEKVFFKAKLLRNKMHVLLCQLLHKS